MGKSFISYEFTPAERLLLLRGLHLMLSDMYQEIYFFGFYDGDETEEDNDKVLGFFSGEDEDDEEDEDEESNFFESTGKYRYDYGSRKPLRKDSDNDDAMDGDDEEEYFDEEEEDDDDMFSDNWRVDRQQMDNLINEIKILENKIQNIDFEEDNPELDINELEILLDSAYEVKMQIEGEEEEWELEAEEDTEDIKAEIRKAIDTLDKESRKQLEEDYEYLIMRQHKDLSSLIDKIKEWIDNYQINSN